MTKIKIILFILFPSLLLGGYDYFPSNTVETSFPSKDFLNMKGTRVFHILENSTDRLSDNKIVELQDKNGLPLWFGRYFYKDICITGICRMVSLWIFWDGAGNYLGIQLDEKISLTKSDHTPFESQDYFRLDEILSDTVSILKELQYEDLVIEDTLQLSVDDKSKIKLFELDGYSSATLPSLKEYVIKDAVFTCYTLWHTVYGETKMHIDELINKRIDSEYIHKLLNGSENYKLLALEMIKRKDIFFLEFEPHIFSLVASLNKNISQKALSVITPQYLNSSEKQLKFIELLDHSLPETKYEILYIILQVNTLSTDAIILLIDQFLMGKISTGSLNQIYKIISKQTITNNNILNNKEIKDRIVQLSKHSDPYTSNLTKNFLKSIK